MDVAARLQAARPAWIRAKRQTGGRGRAGKPWKAASGNLQATWTLPFDRPPPELPLYSFVIALALRDTMSHWLSPDQLTFKWPNDVLAGGRKIAGILLESSAGRLSIGVGLNIVESPSVDTLPEGAWPTTSMAELLARSTTPPPDASLVLTQLAHDLETWRRVWAHHGFAEIRAAWMEDAANLGQQIYVRLPNETLVGTFRDMDETGCLVLETAKGLQTIAAGDVYFGS